MNWILVGSAFIAGISSFLMPCILPLIPVFLVYMTGKTADSIFDENSPGRSVVLNTLAFVVGLIIVFIMLGAIATSLGRLVTANQEIIRKISGIFIALLGLHHMNLIPLKFLNYEYRFKVKTDTPGFMQSMAVGAGFGFGWTPCISPVLTTLLILAGREETVSAGIALLGVYGIGLGMPFLIIAMGYKMFWKHLALLQKHSLAIKKVSGALLIMVGVLLYFNKLVIFSNL